MKLILLVSFVLAIAAVHSVHAIRGGGGGGWRGHGGGGGGWRGGMHHHGGWGGGWRGGRYWGGRGWGYGGYYNYPYYYNPYPVTYPVAYPVIGKRDVSAQSKPHVMTEAQMKYLPNLAELCQLRRNESSLECLGANRLIKCQVEFSQKELDYLQSNAFGIGKVSSYNYTQSNTDMDKYWLYPRDAQDTKWLSNIFKVNNSTTINMALFHKAVPNVRGIKVLSPSCFADLTNTFKAIKDELPIPIEDGKTFTTMFGIITVD